MKKPTLLRAEDLALYLSCPILYQKKKYSKIYPPLTVFETCIKDAIILGEERALLQDRVVTPRNLLTAWDRVWWESALGKNITVKDAERLSLAAGIKFSDYCKYDFVDYNWPALDVNCVVSTALGPERVLVSSNVDIVKMDLETKTTVLIKFVNFDPSKQMMAFDITSMFLVWRFFQSNAENISCLFVNISEKVEGIKTHLNVFQPSDIGNIERVLEQAVRGITNGVSYGNPLMCEGCRVCRL